MPHDTAQIRQLLLTAFSDMEFEVFCYDEYREVANDFTDGQVQSKRVQMLLEYVEHRKGFDRLLELVKRDRPEKYNEYQIGITLLTVRKMVEKELRFFSDTFQGVLDKIDVITDYKTLHDGLHELHYILFPLIEEDVRGLEEDKNARSNLTRHDLNFQRIIKKMRERLESGESNRKKIDPEKAAWIGPLDEARKRLKKGLADSDAEQIESALQSIRNILEREPAAINDELYAEVTTENRQLPELITVMGLVCERLESAEPESVTRYKKGLALLRDMRAKLDKFVNEHNSWQKVDLLLPTAGDFLEGDMASFHKPWQRAKVKAATYYREGEDEWAVDFRDAEANVERQVTAKDLDGARIAFSLYCNKASARFYDVDTELLKLCTSLQEIRQYLP